MLNGRLETGSTAGFWGTLTFMWTEAGGGINLLISRLSESEAQIGAKKGSASKETHSKLTPK